MGVYECIGYLCGVLFVPLVPAYIIFKFLPPSKTIVRGPFKGLKINLAGAFGGYFLLVLITLSFTYTTIRPSKPRHEVWYVKGRIEAKWTDPNTGKETNDVHKTKIGVMPPDPKIETGGKFTTPIIVTPGHVEGERKFPVLVFNLPGYTSPSFLLDIRDPNMIFNEKTGWIELTEKVILERLN